MSCEKWWVAVDLTRPQKHVYRYEEKHDIFMINLILTFDVVVVDVVVAAALHKEIENYLWLFKAVDT